MRASAGGESARTRALRFAAVTAVAFLVPFVFAGRPFIHSDTLLDFLAARELSENGRWLGVGTVISEGATRDLLSGIPQGTLPPNLIGLLLALGLPISMVWNVTLAAQALSAGLVVELAARRVGGLGLLALAPWAVLGLRETFPPVLWSSSYLALPVAAFWWFLCTALEREGRLPLLLAGAVMAFATGLHIVAFVLLPLWLAAVPMVERRPARMVALALAGAAMPALLMVIVAPANARSIGARLIAPVPLALGLVALLALLAWSRLSILRTSSAMAQATLLAGTALGLFVLGAIVTGRTLQLRYLAPIVPAIASLVVWHARQQVDLFADSFGKPLSGSVRTLLVWLLVVAPALALAGQDDMFSPDSRWRPPEGSFEDEEVMTIGRHFAAQGRTHRDLSMHLWGPQRTVLMPALHTVELAQRPDPPAEAPDVLLVTVRKEALPAPVPSGWTTLPASDGKTFVIRAAQGRLRHDRISGCWNPGDQISGPDLLPTAACLSLNEPPPSDELQLNFGLRASGYGWKLRTNYMHFIGAHGMTRRVRETYIIPFASASPQEPLHHIDLAGCALENGWRLALRSRGRTVEVAQTGEATLPAEEGDLLVFRDVDLAARMDTRFPGVMETFEEETTLRLLLRTSACTED